MTGVNPGASTHQKPRLRKYAGLAAPIAVMASASGEILGWSDRSDELARIHAPVQHESDGPGRRKAVARAAPWSPTRRLRCCMAGVVRGGGLPSHRAEGAVRPRRPAHRRSDRRARPAPVASASRRATEVCPPAGNTRRHPCSSGRDSCRRPRCVARRRGARTGPGVRTLKPDRLRVELANQRVVRSTAARRGPITHA